VLAVSLGLGSGRRCGVARIAEPARSYDKLLLVMKEAWEADDLLALVREMPGLAGLALWRTQVCLLYIGPLLPLPLFFRFIVLVT
jgi:hypothetical protein